MIGFLLYGDDMPHGRICYLARLRERGVPMEPGPFPARYGQRANFAIRDSAGSLIQFFGR